MARVEGEDRSQNGTADDICIVMPMIGDASDTNKASPQHQQTLQKRHKEERLQLWKSTLKIPNEKERCVDGNACMTCGCEPKYRE
jgi:hypothetical protein